MVHAEALHDACMNEGPQACSGITVRTVGIPHSSMLQGGLQALFWHFELHPEAMLTASVGPPYAQQELAAFQPRKGAIHHAAACMGGLLNLSQVLRGYATHRLMLLSVIQLAGPSRGASCHLRVLKVRLCALRY